MKALKTVTEQRHKESKLLKIFVVSSLMGSVVVHTIVLSLPVSTLWSDRVSPEAELEEIEILVSELPEEVPPETFPETSPEISEEMPLETPEPEWVEPVQEVAIAPVESIAPEPPDPETPDPETPEPIAEEAPAPEVPLENLVPESGIAENPLHSEGGNLNLGHLGSLLGWTPGEITSPQGRGTGLGNGDESSGSRRSGTSQGQEQTGRVSVRATPTPQPPPAVPPPNPELRCLKCPKPEYQGTEASPKVELRIRPDGSVDVRLRESSGNPELDRKTLEVMSQWQFDPETVPEDGLRQRVRVTYEEDGSRFQRENERRRQAEQQAAEQREAEQEAARAAQAAEAEPQQAEADRLESEVPPETPLPDPVDSTDPVLPLQDPIAPAEYTPEPVEPEPVDPEPVDPEPVEEAIVEPVEEYISEPEEAPPE